MTDDTLESDTIYSINALRKKLIVYEPILIIYFIMFVGVTFTIIKEGNFSLFWAFFYFYWLIIFIFFYIRIIRIFRKITHLKQFLYVDEYENEIICIGENY